MGTINYLTRIEFDDGALSRLGAVLKDVGIQRPLIVTDRGLFGSPLFAELLSTMKGIEHAVFADTPQNPTDYKQWGEDDDASGSAGGASGSGSIGAPGSTSGMGAVGARDNLWNSEASSSNYNGEYFKFHQLQSFGEE